LIILLWVSSLTIHSQVCFGVSCWLGASRSSVDIHASFTRASAERFDFILRSYCFSAYIISTTQILSRSLPSFDVVIQASLLGLSKYITIPHVDSRTLRWRFSSWWRYNERWGSHGDDGGTHGAARADVPTTTT
jgi:hypothetical protein